MMKKHMLLVFLLIAFSFVAAQEIIEETDLIRKDYNIDEDPNIPIFKTAPDMKWVGNRVYVVDNRLNTIFMYDYSPGDKLEFVKTIGRSGQGPGDFFHPAIISNSDNKIVVIDQHGITALTAEGVFIDRLPIFTPKTSTVVLENKIYYIYINPMASHLIEACLFDGEKILKFGEKFLNLNFDKNKGISDSIVELLAYDGILLNDEEHIYYVSKRFGKLLKYNLKGELILEKDITDFFGKSGKEVVKKNIKLFQKKGIDSYKLEHRIPTYELFRKARICGEEICFVSFHYKPKDGIGPPFMEILTVDKNKIEPVKKYRTNLVEKDFITSFDVRMYENRMVFLILIDTEEGFVFSEFREN